MARNLNKVMFIGHLGDAPEIRYLPNGDPVATVNLATSHSWKDKSTGEIKEDTQWHRLVAFRRLAEIMKDYSVKGSKLYVEGRLRHRPYEVDGGKRWITEVVLNDVQLLDRRPSDAAKVPDGSYPPAPGGDALPPIDSYDDDLV